MCLPAFPLSDPNRFTKNRLCPNWCQKLGDVSCSQILDYQEGTRKQIIMCVVPSMVPVYGDGHRDSDNDDFARLLDSYQQPEVATGVKAFIVLNFTQVVGLLLAAFTVGSLMPYIWWKTPHNLSHSSSSLSSDNQIGIAMFNNLRHSSLDSRTADERQSPKIAWRKSN